MEGTVNMFSVSDSGVISGSFYAVICITLFWFVSRYGRAVSRTTSSMLPPGNRGLPFVGETLQFLAAIGGRNGFYDFVRLRRLRYGTCFKTNIFGLTHVFVTGSESAKTVLNNESGKFTKRYIRSIAAVVGDQSLLCASKQHHRLIRSSLSGLFSTSSLSTFIRHFDRLTYHALLSWADRSTHIVVLDEALEITFRAICKMIVGWDDGEDMERLRRDVACVCEAMLALPLKLPFFRFYNGIQARKRIMNTLERMISERRRGIKPHNEDFLKQLLLSHVDKTSDDGAPLLTDSQIKDNILTMIIAGQDTTASAITWMVKYLDENKEVLSTLKAEQLLLEKKLPRGSYLTLEDLSNMPFASKVVKESLRFASVVAWLPRMALEDCELEGYKIKKGWNVNVDARSIHFDPSIYKDPDKFLPSRFEIEPKPQSYLAFGAGARTCLGLNLAKAMMLVFLHRLVTTYEWRVMDSDSSIESWALFSRPKNGCPIHVKPLSVRSPTHGSTNSKQT